MTIELANQAVFGLARIATALRSTQWRASERHGLTPTQIDILTILRRRGSGRVKMLAAQLAVTHATASDAVTAMQMKGLVEKHPDPHDGRAVLVKLTNEGERAASAGGEYPHALVGAVEQLQPDETAGLHRSLVKIIRSLQEEGVIEPQRLCVTCRFFRPNAHNGEAKPHHCAYVDAAFGDAELRLDCSDHQQTDEAEKKLHWRRFLDAAPA